MSNGTNRIQLVEIDRIAVFVKTGVSRLRRQQDVVKLLRECIIFPVAIEKMEY